MYKSNFKVFSFYTNGTPYEQEAERLKRSLEELEIEHVVLGVDDRGSWKENVNLKPNLILDFIKKEKCPILWVDADAEFLRKPNLISSICEQGYDVGCHRMEVDSHIVSSGTVFFNYNPRTLKFIEDWNVDCDQRMARGEYKYDIISMEQWAFGWMLEAYVKEGKIRNYNLPADYYAIVDFDGVRFHQRESFDIPAIKHHQASRQNRSYGDEE